MKSGTRSLSLNRSGPVLLPPLVLPRNSKLLAATPSAAARPAKQCPQVCARAPARGIALPSIADLHVLAKPWALLRPRSIQGIATKPADQLRLRSYPPWLDTDRHSPCELASLTRQVVGCARWVARLRPPLPLLRYRSCCNRCPDAGRYLSRWLSPDFTS